MKHRSCGAAPLTKPAFHVLSRSPGHGKLRIRQNIDRSIDK